MFDFLMILLLSVVLTSIAMYLYHKQSKHVEGLKVGDNVNLQDLIGEITDVKENSFVLKIEVPKMRVSKNKIIN